MDSWIEIARGPLFRMALAICVLGLGYRLGVLTAQIGAAWHRAGDRRLPVGQIAAATASWLVPLRLWRARPVYSTASVLFHIGVTVVPIFLAGHLALLAGIVPGWWPVLSGEVADTLTLISIVAVLALLVGRLSFASARAVNRPQDVLVLVLLSALLSLGWLAAHPALNPFSARSTLLVHVLLGDVVLILVPITKIAHCALYPLARLVFQLGWHFPAESGRHVAQTLAKEGEPV